MSKIDKPTAAERMIVNAILMVERNDDPLAIHVVASSALNLLRELIKISGNNYMEQVFRLGTFAAANAKISGNPISIPNNPKFENLIERLARDIEAGAVNGPSDLSINLNQNELHKLLKYITTPYNFLKHADEDPSATLDESDFDPQGAIGHAVTALTIACPDKPLPDKIKTYLERLNLI